MPGLRHCSSGPQPRQGRKSKNRDLPEFGTCLTGGRWGKEGGDGPACHPARQALAQQAEQVFVQVPYGPLLLCIPLCTVVGSGVLQSHFAHCQGADRLAGVLLNAEFPLIGLVFEEEPGGHVGNALGSRVGPLLVPVNEDVVKIRVRDVAVDQHCFAFWLGDGCGSLLQALCRAACVKERQS